MKIAVLGTGIVGQTLAGRFSELGHDVVIGTRDPQGTLARTEADAMGNPPFAVWHVGHSGVRLQSFADAAAGAELVVNATSGASSLAVLALAGEQNLDGKLLIDVANPLDVSAGFPPTLFVKDTDSLGEQIQRAFPRAKVVKTLNTMTAAVMVDPRGLVNAEHSIFLCGDDAVAKATVSELLRSFGWEDVIDLGGLSSARGAEMLLPIWLMLMNTLGTAAFNFRIVR